MFSAIAPKYDFLNRALSFGFDRYWRRIAVDKLMPQNDGWILDIATGTAEISIEIASRNSHSIKIFGADFSLPMLKLGKKKY